MADREHSGANLDTVLLEFRREVIRRTLYKKRMMSAVPGLEGVDGYSGTRALFRRMGQQIWRWLSKAVHLGSGSGL